MIAMASLKSGVAKNLLPSKQVDKDVDDIEQLGNDIGDNGEEYKFWLDDVSGKSITRGVKC